MRLVLDVDLERFEPLRVGLVGCLISVSMVLALTRGSAVGALRLVPRGMLASLSGVNCVV